MSQAKLRGKIAESHALTFLKQQGLSLVKANFYSRFGEIDLIMYEPSAGYVFVEVRQRQGGINQAIESITPAKQRKLIKTAEYFLLKLGSEVNCRFDAIVMDQELHIEWLKNIIIL